MAVAKRERKSHVLRRARPNKPAKIVTKRGKIHGKPKRNSSSYLTSRPLMSRHFNRKMPGDVLALHKSRRSLNPGIANTDQKLSLRRDRQRKPQPFVRGGPRALRATLREVARKKQAKKVVELTRKKRRYADNEIFYKLANSPAASKDCRPSSTEGEAVGDVASHHSCVTPDNCQ